MPFDDSPKDPSKRLGLKQVSGQKSMFDEKPRPQTQEQFQKKVQQEQDNTSEHKKKAADLYIQFMKSMSDKTLTQNKNIFNADTEREMLKNIIELAQDINADENEQDDMGTLTLITFLFKSCILQRDRNNDLEHSLVELNKKIESKFLQDFILKEINKAVDKKQNGG